MALTLSLSLSVSTSRISLNSEANAPHCLSMR
jgi:hypothetical protein